MPELKVFGDACEEEVIFSLDGEDFERFPIDEYRMWRGQLELDNGESVIIQASFYVDNPNGWYIWPSTKSPWEYKTKTLYNDSYDSDEDVYLVFKVPRGLPLVRGLGF